MSLGWTCPVCRAGLAPHVTRCTHGNDFGSAGVRSPLPPVLPFSPQVSFYTCQLCGVLYHGIHTCWTVVVDQSSTRITASPYSQMSCSPNVQISGETYVDGLSVRATNALASDA